MNPAREIIAVNNRFGRREDLRELLGRSLDMRGAAAVQAGAGNGGAHRTRWRALGLALALLAVLIALAVLATSPPEQAAAQTVTTFISNTGQTSTTDSNLNRATSFTTGAGTYTLTSVGIHVSSANDSTNPQARIYENGADDEPGDLVATLTAPASLSAGAVNTFTAPANTSLSANTLYWLVTNDSASSGGLGFRVSTISSTTTDDGATAGWSIGDALFRGTLTAPWTTTSIQRIKFQVRGTLQTTTTNAAPTVANAIADRTATVGTFFSASIPANTFADTDTGDTLTYTATKSDDSALPSWLSFNATTVLLSGTPAAGDVGTVTVKVTASDGNGGSVSDEFDIVVSAAAAQADRAGTVALASQPELGIPMTATLTDADGSISGTTWQWSSSATASGTFADITGATEATYSPAEADLTKFLRATVSYTDALASGKNATETAANAVHVVDRVLVANLDKPSNAPGNSATYGIATRFQTGNHPGGYKLSEVRFFLGGSHSSTSTSVHIYSAHSVDGYPVSSLFQLVNPASLSNQTTFTAPSGARLAPNTVYHVAVRGTGPHIRCSTAANNAHSAGSASDWSLSGTVTSVELNSQGNYDDLGAFDDGCRMRISGQAAIDTSHITDLEITSSPAVLLGVAAGYATGETLEATVTFSEAVTVDTTTPPTLKVVIGSNTRTMTYNAMDSSSTELQFDYTVVAADKDGNGASFNEDALTGTITRTSDSKAADLDHAAVADDAGARVNPVDTAGSLSLSTTQPEMGIPMTATLTDPDGSISGTTWQWSSSATASGTFADISGATSATYSPAEADLTKFLRATVSYTDGHGPDKSATATATKAVRASRVHIVSTLSQVSGNARYEKPGIATQFTTGAHPGGYKLSDVRIRLRGTYTASSFQVHIYDSDSDGDPNESVYRLENPASISGVTSFDAPSGTRLAPSTTYHLAMVRSSGNVECETATADAYDSGRASDWTTGGAYALTGQGAYDDASNTLGCGMRLSGQAAIDTSYITGLEITSGREFPGAGYLTGEKLTATVTFSEALTVDTTTPPTLKVVIGSNTRTMTYNATESLSTTLEFDYFVQSADKDANGVSFNEDALTGTITRTS